MLTAWAKLVTGMSCKLSQGQSIGRPLHTAAVLSERCTENDDKNKVEKCEQPQAVCAEAKGAYEEPQDVCGKSEDSLESQDSCESVANCPITVSTPESVCVDPCVKDEYAEEIAEHVGTRCARDPCGKVMDPCENFIKEHVGITKKDCK